MQNQYIGASLKNNKKLECSKLSVCSKMRKGLVKSGLHTIRRDTSTSVTMVIRIITTIRVVLSQTFICAIYNKDSSLCDKIQFSSLVSGLLRK